MIIYKITNLINGKIYIGQTIVELAKRFHAHVAASNRAQNKTPIYRAMRKYGKQNFIIEQIDQAKDRDELNKKEIYWIKELNTKDPNVGYNLADGGIGGITSGIGEDHPRSKLTNKDAEEIRYLLTDVNIYASVLANYYSVKRSTIQDIRSYSTWNHIPLSVNPSNELKEIHQELIAGILDKGLEKWEQSLEREQKRKITKRQRRYPKKKIPTETGKGLTNIRTRKYPNLREYKIIQYLFSENIPNVAISEYFKIDTDIISLLRRNKMKIYSKHFTSPVIKPTDEIIQIKLKCIEIMNKIKEKTSIKMSATREGKLKCGLTNEDVSQILNLYYNQKFSTRKICKIYKVARGTISNIIKKANQ